MADRNPILKPVTDPSVQFEPAVQQQAIQDIVINGTAGGGGGGTATVAASDIKKGEVTAYDLTLRTGTATIDGASTAFRDGTMRNLANGDNIVLNKLANDAKDWVSVGVLKPNAGSGTGPTYIAPTINVGYPVNTQALPYIINGPQYVSLDITNGLTYGNNTIIGQGIGTTAARSQNGAVYRAHNATTGVTTSIPNTSGVGGNFTHGSYLYAGGGAARWSPAGGWTYFNTATNTYTAGSAPSSFNIAGFSNGYIWFHQTAATAGGLWAADTAGNITRIWTNGSTTNYATQVIIDNGYAWWIWTGTNPGTYTSAATVAFPTATGNNTTFRVSTSSLIPSVSVYAAAVDTNQNIFHYGSFGGARSIVKTFPNGTQQTFPYVFSSTGLASDGEPITSISAVGVYAYGISHLRSIGGSLFCGGAVRGSYAGKTNTTLPYPAIWQTDGTTTTLIQTGDEYTAPAGGSYTFLSAICQGPIAATGTDSYWKDSVYYQTAVPTFVDVQDKVFRGTL